MANENPNPLQVDPSQVELILAGNVADDDLMWIVRCSIEELHRFFLSPVAWVASLANLPDWRYAGSPEKAPPPVLLPDLALSARAATKPDPDGWVTLYGISETNAVVALATVESAVASAARLGGTDLGPDPLAWFWTEVSADPANPPSLRKPFLVNVVPALGRFVGHFEIVGEGQGTPEDRARTVATFLLASVFDPKGLAAMLTGLDQSVLYVVGKERRMGRRIDILPNPMAATVGGVYANMEATGALETASAQGRDRAGDEPPVASCYVLDGPYTPIPGDGEGGTGNPAGGTIKRYGVE